MTRSGKIPVLTALWILLSCAGCGLRYEYIRPPVPAALLEPCPVPELTGSTWADVARLAHRRGEALTECSARLQAVRKIIRPDDPEL
jgi:hypothetical protein